MAHAQKPDFVFLRNGRVHLNRWGRQFSRLLAAEVCASASVMLDTQRSEMAWEYWLPTPFASFPFTSPPVRHRVPPGSERALPPAATQPIHSTRCDGALAGEFENFFSPGPEPALWGLAYSYQTVLNFGTICNSRPFCANETTDRCLITKENKIKQSGLQLWSLSLYTVSKLLG